MDDGSEVDAGSESLDHVHSKARGSLLRRAIENHWSFVAVTLAAYFVASILFIVQKGIEVSDWYHRPTWQEKEIKRLSGLYSLYDIRYIVQRLGRPVFVRKGTATQSELFGPAKHVVVSEYTFHGRGWWVQAVVNSSGSALQYAVTSCDSTLQIPILAPGGLARVVLQKDTMAGAARSRDKDWKIGTPFEYYYFLPGATSNAHIFDMYYEGNGGEYQSFAVGADDICQNWYLRTVDRKSIYLKLGGGFSNTGYGGLRTGFVGLTDHQHPISHAIRAKISATRSDLIVNTYVETAPGEGFYSGAFPGSLGANRLLGRTLQR